MAIGTLTITLVSFSVIGLILSSLLLWLTAYLFKIKDNVFNTAFFIAFLVSVVSYIPYFIPFINDLTKGISSFFVSIIAGFFLVQRKYKLDTKRTIAMTAVWIVLTFLAFGLMGAIYRSLYTGIGI